MRIGLDFDNTIAGYDHVFPAVARRTGLLPEDFRGGKREVREAVRALPDGEREWMKLQGQVYGRFMSAAELLPGADRFLELCRRRGVEVFVVSHKTATGHFDEAAVDLHAAALDWMRAHGFFDATALGVPERNVHFLPTRDEKVERIRQLRLDAFVDDLEDVLAHPDFPKGVRRLQYAAPDAIDGDWERCRDWNEIANALFNEPSPRSVEEVAQDLAPVAVRSVERVGQGGNNRTYHVKTDLAAFALKTYLHHPADDRDRFGAERTALELLHARSRGTAPRPVAVSERDRAILMEWIDGEVALPADQDSLDRAASFALWLHDLAQSPLGLEVPRASEACLHGAELVRQVRERLERLQAVACLEPKLERLLSDELLPQLDTEAERLERIYAEHGRSPEAPLPHAERTLSPSDFGLHNALRRADGSLVFFDMEYFGWDDPVKLVSDFLLHPAMALTTSQQQRFLSATAPRFGTDRFFVPRLKAQYRLYGLRWCAILLNAFVPERRARLAYADARQGEAALNEQLEKASTLASRLRLEAHPIDEL